MLPSFLANVSYEAADTGLREVRGGCLAQLLPLQEAKVLQAGLAIRTTGAERPGDFSPGLCDPTMGSLQLWADPWTPSLKCLVSDV